MNILVTGGAGYIGSHTCISLIESGHDVIIADNLSNSKIEILYYIEKITGIKVKFYESDVTDENELEKIFSQNDIDGVIHFAGFKAVGESVEKPIEYYYNNLISTILLSKMCTLHGVNKIVFSSSATVYGENKVPFEETMELLPTTNPYGETKAISEKILRDVSNAYPKLSVILLRYFNPVGAHKSGLIGENPNGIPNNLMPFITQVAKGKLQELKVFGDDYDTVDGTGVRDYIHVIDLAKGHVAAIEKSQKGTSVYNLGTGRGTSVLELIKAFEKINGIKIPYSITKRRQGDIAECYADVKKAEEELGWTAELGVEDMVRDAWNFEKKRA
ncbi:UDP-glucose 4-epimerase GalE [Alkalibacter saccharofermentans]|uniref:UDP-glucose 4-epimerase n=1 Tax=Alkalibacter saccharofermentans DSM 14828 TaxID=1120975 RepID=A0A1M4SG59_9FIRM|nr:UDP-glucose 4-epimerase GalE [Alkalibacter saccharofermentans]SHE31213.1 UDP-glucose 4-epimerase [Alkalibacter saccharofermentans DSM 14828]